MCIKLNDDLCEPPVIPKLQDLRPDRGLLTTTSSRHFHRNWGGDPVFLLGGVGRGVGRMALRNGTPVQRS